MQKIKAGKREIIVDDADHGVLSKYVFFFQSTYGKLGRIVARKDPAGKKINPLAATKILFPDLPKTQKIEYADGNPLNFQRANLKIVERKAPKAIKKKQADFQNTPAP